MTARPQIENVLGRAAWGTDEDDVDLVAAQFTEDAVMTLRIADGETIGPFEGREAIRRLHADSLATQTDQRRHNISNVVIVTESADRAEVTSNLTLLSIEGGMLRVLSSGWYSDELVREGSGEDAGWRIARRHVQLDLPY